MVRESLGILLLLAVQLGCAMFFLFGIVSSLFGLNFAPVSWAVYEMIEIAVALSLILGVIVSAALLVRSLKARKTAEDQLRLLSGAFMDMLQDRFTLWGLTPAEKDVALFSIKGLSIGEIAQLRGTSEGTVKAQSNAIYRKAGVSGRSQLVSLFIEDLMHEGVPSPEPVDKCA